MIKTCMHVDCQMQLRRGQAVCAYHYKQLSDEVRGAIKDLLNGSERDRLNLRVAVQDYFAALRSSRRKTKTCSAERCDVEVVWLRTRKNRQVLVRADTVDGGDEEFDIKKHVAHFPDSDDCFGSQS